VTEAVYAGAVIEERQLLKSLRWYDGFVIALANPGYLLGEQILAEVVPLWPEKCCLDVTDNDPMIGPDE